MRKSRYTVVVEGDAGEALAYNTANGAFAAFDGRARAALEAFGAANGVDAGSAAVATAATSDGIDPAIVSVLADAGFLTDRTADEELAAQQARFAAASGDTDRLTLSIAPTYACNCRCPYCYEQDKDTAASMMGPDVRAAILAFVRERFAAHPFSQLSVQWYGGDPSLALDVVEELSGALIAWCDERGVAYSAMMLSNCARIDGAAAALLARCRVESVLVTIDGPRDIHNVRRPTVEGDDAFAHVMDAIDALQANGVRVDGMINLDKVTMPLYPQLRRELAARGVDLAPAKLNDYAHTFGQGHFAPPAFDLFTHEEFHLAERDAFLAEPHAAEEFREMLRPVCRFCEGQRANYFVVDYRGDVYRCDGWMGDRTRAIGSLMEREEGAGTRAFANADETRVAGDRVDTAALANVRLAEAPITFDPFEHDDCRACELLPQCWGNCSWERELCGWPCHPFRETLGDFLRAWRRCFGDPGKASERAGATAAARSVDGVVLLAPPLAEEEIVAAG